MAIKALITDLDGTLCNTKEANTEAYKQAFADCNVPFDESAYRTNFGLAFHDMMLAIAPQHSDQWPNIAERKAIHYKNLGDMIEPNTALIKLLKDAKLNGKKIGLASTAKAVNGKSVLSSLKISDVFDEVIFAEDTVNKKPDPECYSAIMNRLGVKPEECLIFEDTEIGIKAAVSAGSEVIKISL